MNNYQEINKILRNKMESRNIQKKMLIQKIENLQKQIKDIDETNRKTEKQIQENEGTSIYQKKEETDYSLKELQNQPSWNLLPPSEQKDLLSGKTKIFSD